MILAKWNYKKHNYEPYKIPDKWNCKTYCDDMSEEVNCVECGKKLKFSNCYTSLEVHSMPFAFRLCSL